MNLYEKTLSDTDSIYCRGITNSHQSSIFITQTNSEAAYYLFGNDYTSNSDVVLVLSRTNLMLNVLAHYLTSTSYYKRSSSDKWDLTKQWLSDKKTVLDSVFKNDHARFHTQVNKETTRTYLKGITSIMPEGGSKAFDLRNYLFSGDTLRLVRQNDGSIRMIILGCGGDDVVDLIEESRKKEFYDWLISKKLSPDYADDLVNSYLVCLSDELKMPPVKTAWHGLREYLYGEKPGKSIYAVTDSHELIKYYGEIDRLFAKIAEPGPLDVKRFNECRAWADSKDNNRAVRAAWIQYKDFMKWRDAQQSTEELPKNVDLLSVALKLFAEKRAVDTTEVWDNYDQWTHSVREEFSQVDEALLGDPNFDYAAYMRKYAISVQTANVYFATHTTKEKRAVLKFLSDQRDAPMAASYYIDEKNRFQVDGKNVNGMGPTVMLYFMSELWPEEFAVWSTPTWDSLSFLGLYNGPTPKDVTIDTYEVCRSKQQQIIARMKELGIGKASDDASDADYRTVNEFLWWLGQDDNKDLIKKEAMAAMYQKTEIKKVQQTKITDFSDFIKKLENDVTSAGFKYAPGLMKRFVCAQLAKPFVVLTGLSGSGKTKLAQAFSEWIAVENTSLVVPVGADWTNSERLLGFPNALDPDNYVLPDTRVLEFILDARDHQDLPFFLILDEMNLSHVERYFADFLSAMESGDEIKLYAGKDRYASNGRLIPQTLEIPKNLFVIGTMNVDETTYMFSPKVLDRAQVIEFRVSKQEMSDFLAKPGNPKLSDLADKGVEFAKAFLDLAGERKTKQPAAPELTDVKTALDAFFPSLAELGAEFGYRTAIEIVTFVAYYLDASGYAKMPVGTNKKTCLTQAIDAAILQKLLPKLHGAINRLGPVLDALVEKSIQKIPQANDPDAEPTIQEIYPLTYEKLKRMKVRLEKNNFTSFAEA